MKRLIGVALICAMSLSLVTGCSPETVDITETSETTAGFSSRPQDDFYYYVNKDALENAVFEYGASYAADANDSSLVDGQIETIIKDVVAGSGYEKGSEEYIIQTAYNAYLAYDFANEPIPVDLVNVINEVKNAKSADELVMLDAKLYRDYGVYGFFSVFVTENSFASGENVICLMPFSSMVGVGFDDIRDNSIALNPIVTDTKIYLQTLDYDADTSTEYGRALANVVLKIFGSTDLDVMDSKCGSEYEKLISFEELDSVFTNVDMMEYFKAVGFDEQFCDKISVYDIGQMECLNSVLVDENLNALKAWTIIDIYNTYMSYIAPHYPVLSGYVMTSYDTPEEDAIEFVRRNLADETDPIYVERYYTKETDDALRSMCDDIREGYRGVITNATWLTETTRKGLLEKLDNIVYVTGTNVKRHDASKYAGLSGNLYELSLEYQKIMIADDIKSLSQPVDRFSSSMNMQTVNACYMRTTNSITITVASTNEPFFNPDADYYTNLGGLGATIAHEMGHAFDSNCIVFDKDGVYNPGWIADEDMKVLTERNKKAASYFEDNFTVFGIYHVDGERTLGENYADLGGMEVLVTLAKTDDDLRKLFESYARSWCCKKVDTAIMYQLAYDVHSPEVIRVNAILSTLDCYYEVYDVKEGDAMYIAPENRISRWF